MKTTEVTTLYDKSINWDKVQILCDRDAERASLPTILVLTTGEHTEKFFCGTIISGTGKVHKIGFRGDFFIKENFIKLNSNKVKVVFEWDD